MMFFCSVAYNTPRIIMNSLLLLSVGATAGAVLESCGDSLRLQLTTTIILMNDDGGGDGDDDESSAAAAAASMMTNAYSVDDD